MLSQVGEDSVEHPIAYFRRLLWKEELKYALTPNELECLALLKGIQHFQPYLWGKQFDIYTDHKALKWLYQTKDTNE